MLMSHELAHINQELLGIRELLIVHGLKSKQVLH